MFVDKAEVTVKAGDGGPGVVSFRHEKYVDRGGPDGGDGGKGGDVVFRGRDNQHTLARFRHQRELKADAGQSGGKRKRRGKSAEDLLIDVPVGTEIVDSETNQTIADITQPEQTVVVANGGSGGFGNAHFKSSTRQAPRIAEKGEPGEERLVSLELKMIADVGIVGLPNAGKSTFLSVVSNAQPEIANYPFTTLQPNLGVVDVDNEHSLLFADIPGLIAGASKGKGLGDDFLRHVERTAVLLHLIDAYQDDVTQAYQTIQQELAEYKVDLTDKPQIIALTKVEGLDEEILADQQAAVQSATGNTIQVFTISSQTKQGIDELLRELLALVETFKAQAVSEVETTESPAEPVITLPSADESWQVVQKKKRFIVTGKKIERFAHKTDAHSEPAVDRLRDIMRKMGIMHELERKGIEPGSRIDIADIISLEY